VTDVFLGVIAVATLAIAIAQIGVMVVAGLLAKRVGRLAEQIDRDLKPLFAHLNAIGRDASRTAALASAQMERAVVLCADIVGRVELVLDNIQSALGTPAREGRALLSGFRAAIQAIRELRQDGRTRQRRSEDEDALFI
jgi:hypothetical protein